MLLSKCFPVWCFWYPYNLPPLLYPPASLFSCLRCCIFPHYFIAALLCSTSAKQISFLIWEVIIPQFLPGSHSFFIWTDSSWRGAPSTCVIWIASQQKSMMMHCQRKRKGEVGVTNLYIIYSLPMYSIETYILLLSAKHGLTFLTLSIRDRIVHIHLVWYPSLYVFVCLYLIVYWLFLLLLNSALIASLSQLYHFVLFWPAHCKLNCFFAHWSAT